MDMSKIIYLFTLYFNRIYLTLICLNANGVLGFWGFGVVRHRGAVDERAAAHVVCVAVVDDRVHHRLDVLSTRRHLAPGGWRVQVGGALGAGARQVQQVVLDRDHARHHGRGRRGHQLPQHVARWRVRGRLDGRGGRPPHDAKARHALLGRAPLKAVDVHDVLVRTGALLGLDLDAARIVRQPVHFTLQR